MSLCRPGSRQCQEGPRCTRPSVHTAVSAFLRAPPWWAAAPSQDAETQRVKDVLQACRDKTPTWRLQGQGTTTRLPSVCLSTHPSWPSSTHYPVCPSAYLHVSTHTSIPSSVCPSVCWSSIHLSLHLPTSFLLSIHPCASSCSSTVHLSAVHPQARPRTPPSLTHISVCPSTHLC